MKPKRNQKPVHTKRNKKMFYRKIEDKYIDPFTDFGFKKLFGQECNKDLLLDFLNELFHKKEGRIVSISYLNTEKLGIVEDTRKAVLDLFCENEKGEKFIVELQKAKQDFFKDRTLFYSTFPIIEQAPAGKWDFKLKSIYIVAILNFVFEEDKKKPHKYRYDIMLSDIETHKVFYDKLTFTYLEMPKFTKEVDELKTHFDKWMYVIKNLKRLDDVPDKLRNSIFEKMFAAAEVAKLTPEEYMKYLTTFYTYSDWDNCLATAKREGTEKGLAEGRAEGRAEKQEIIVINSHQAGLSLEMIATITGLSVEEISKILEKHKC
ncbi:MAG: Rpn family recombination-promoting nuclease/putative transposase [Lentimicrobiaceae bacterium]|nr:Rpn family recombination-promoting nuclease/putative transposase [Lentimicrobiaceae bacterium]